MNPKPDPPSKDLSQRPDVYQHAGDIVRAQIRYYEALSPGVKPPLKWLAAHSHLSLACVSIHRRKYYAK